MFKKTKKLMMYLKIPPRRVASTQQLIFQILNQQLHFGATECMRIVTVAASAKPWLVIDKWL